MLVLFFIVKIKSYIYNYNGLQMIMPAHLMYRQMVMVQLGGRESLCQFSPWKLKILVTI
jgi:hypothetical protein